MRLKVIPADFVVVEDAALHLQPDGRWAVYQVKKSNLTTLQVRRRLAQRLSLSYDQVSFPALKDRRAHVVQYATLPADRPDEVREDGFVARKIGLRRNPLAPADLRGNRFKILVRDLAQEEGQALGRSLRKLAANGLPNYFDRQRFGSFSPGWGFVGRAILQRDAEAALQAHLARPFVGDPPQTLRFKEQAAELWPAWEKIMDVAPAPSNYRSVLTYLIDHPEGFRRALDLVTPRLLSIYLLAYQSYLWNVIVARYLEEKSAGLPMSHIDLPGQCLVVPHVWPREEAQNLAKMRVDLPSHRARYGLPQLASIVYREMQAEGFVLNDLKARILKRAYLYKGERHLMLHPGEMETAALEADDRFVGRYALWVSFSLPPGAYATMVIRVARALTGEGSSAESDVGL